MNTGERSWTRWDLYIYKYVGQHARMRGAKRVACASTGNTSASMAVFCAVGQGVSGIIFIGSGKIGPVTKQIRDLYFRVVRGNEPDYMHWLTPISQPESVAS